MFNIESLCATRNALQVQAILAARQGTKSAKVCQLEEEIAKLRSNLSNFVSSQSEDGSSWVSIDVYQGER